MLSNQLMARGKTGLFSLIENAANLRNGRTFVAVSALLFALSLLLKFTVPELSTVPFFMVFSLVMLLISIVELVIVQRKKGIGTYLKWLIGIGFIASAIGTTASMGAVGSIIVVFPILLSIQYCSVLYSLFISVVTVMGTFAPLLLASHLSNYDLNVVRLVPGAVIQVSSTLEASLGSGIINEAGTKLNELLTVSLPLLLLINILAVVSIAVTGAIRRSLLEQYHQFQNTRE